MALGAKHIRPSAELTEALAAGQAPAPATVTRLTDLNAQIARLRAQLAP